MSTHIHKKIKVTHVDLPVSVAIELPDGEYTHGYNQYKIVKARSYQARAFKVFMKKKEKNDIETLYCYMEIGGTKYVFDLQKYDYVDDINMCKMKTESGAVYLLSDNEEALIQLSMSLSRIIDR